MAVINDLIDKIEDEALRERISKEVKKLSNTKKFGLVFEEHLPECTPLYDVPIRRGSRVAVRDTEIKDTYTVLSVDGDTVKCVSNNSKEPYELLLNDLVTVAEFGEPIYPYLQTIDTVCNAPDSDLWHTLIEADNYHALQLLEYMYAGKVDCIYIDPPYNKEDSKDWKYNCNYVDGNDMYRHSKWLSMMERRLKLAKKLLNSKDSVLIVTIDEVEFLHLGMLLEQLFPEATIQMVSTVNAHSPASRLNEFTRNNEYIFFVMIANYQIYPIFDSNSFDEGDVVNWRTLRRGDIESQRGSSKGGTAQFYPIYVNKETKQIVKLGDALSPEDPIDTVPEIAGCETVFPINDDGIEMNWGLTASSLQERLNEGYVRAKGPYPGKPQRYSIQYLQPASIKSIKDGSVKVIGHEPDGSVIAVYDTKRKVLPKTQWDEPEYDGRDFGTKILKAIVGPRFNFPKSVYAVKDCIKLFVKEKKEALIVDFFAGSGTTLHAVNILNDEDGGNRRCIMVTNNEIGDKTELKMKAAGYRPGDKEWEEIGIARYITWPRTVCSIEGHDINGKPLKGNYIGSDKPMADGFEANAIYFKLGFLDKNAVALGRQFKELLGVLWMKAGAIGPCPHLAKNATVPEMMILPQNKMAILVDETAYATFVDEVRQHPEIETVYIVTDSDRGFREMESEIDVEHSYQLYRDYLDNFRINHRR